MLVLQFALHTVIEAGPAAVDRPQMQTDTSETDHHDALRIFSASGATLRSLGHSDVGTAGRAAFTCPHRTGCTRKAER